MLLEGGFKVDAKGERIGDRSIFWGRTSARWKISWAGNGATTPSSYYKNSKTTGIAYHV